MEPSKNKPEYSLIVAVLLAAVCCLALPLFVGVGVVGLGFFTSPWIVALGTVIVLAVLWVAYRRLKK